MNFKPHAALLALAVLCLAAVAWAADAPPAPQTHAALAGHAGQPMAAAMDDADDLDMDFDAPGIEGDAAGGGNCGERRMVVRRFMRGGQGGECGAGGAGGEGCGRMCGGQGGRGMHGGMGQGMGAGRGPGMGGGMGMGPGGGMFAHVMQAANLTDAQRAKFAEIHERQSRRDIQARADMQIAKLDLRKAMTAEKPEAGAINAQIDRVAKLRTDMAKAHVAALLEARSLLTPEQQKQMREMHQQGPGEGMGRGMGMGPGGMGMGPGGMGGRGMGPGGQRMHVRVERDTVIRR